MKLEDKAQLESALALCRTHLSELYAALSRDPSNDTTLYGTQTYAHCIKLLESVLTEGYNRFGEYGWWPNE